MWEPHAFNPRGNTFDTSWENMMAGVPMRNSIGERSCAEESAVNKILSALAAVCLASVASFAQGAPLTIAYQLTHSINMDPTLSPDGKEMVFISVIGGKEQLFRATIDGRNSRQITHDVADHEDPAWSPDGKRLAFVLLKDGGEQIHLMNPDGSGVELLAPKEQRTIHPNWSPDGKSVAYCTDDDLKPPKKNDSDIYSIEVATRKITKLIGGGVNTYPVWSPDGKKIAFRRMLGESNSEVFVANADGTEARNLTNDAAFDGWPAWSPDGSKIAFASNRNRNYEIFVMNPDGSGVQKVANTEGRGTAPKWSMDGRTIYFTICKNVDLSFDCQVYAAKLDALR
jgi:TolB protein